MHALSSIGLVSQSASIIIKTKGKAQTTHNSTLHQGSRKNFSRKRF